MPRAPRRARTALLLLLALAAGCSKTTKHIVIPPPPFDVGFQPWSAFRGPSTTDVRALASPGGNTIVAGTTSGIWRSADGGTTWARVDGVAVNAMTVDPGNGTLYAGTPGAGVVRSTDGGLSWGDYSVGLVAGANVISIAWAPYGVFAGLASGGGVVAFASGDDHWADASSGLPASSTVNALAFEPGLVLTAGTAAGKTWLFPSGDWVAASLSTAKPVLAVEPIEGGHVLAGVQDQGIFLDNTSAGLPGGTSGFSLVRFSGKDWAGTNHGIYSTANGGASWSHVTGPGLADRMPITSLAVAGGALFAGTAGRGVLRSTDGTTWAGWGPPDARVNALFEGPVGVSFLLAGTSRGIEYSIDGNYWYGATLDSGVVDCFTSQGSTVFAGTLGDGVARSTDMGRTWTDASNGLPIGSGVFRLVSDGTTLFANLVADPVGLYRSLDGGDTWTPVTTLANHENVTDLTVLAGRIYASEFGAGGGVFVSTDHGATWAAANGAFLAGKTVTALGAGGGAVYAATTDNVFFSEDDGVSWHPTLWPGGIAKQIAVHNELVAVVTTSGTVLRTADAGEHWDQQTPAGEQVLSVAAGLGSFFVGTETRGWASPY